MFITQKQLGTQVSVTVILWVKSGKVWEPLSSNNVNLKNAFLEVVKGLF